MGRAKHINKTRAEDITLVYRYLEKCSNRGNRTSIKLHRKTVKQLEDITAEIFKVSAKAVSRILKTGDQNGLYNFHHCDESKQYLPLCQWVKAIRVSLCPTLTI